MTGAPVDIVIVNWNAGTMLAECVASVSCEARDIVASVVVVDNGSIDGSANIASSDVALTIDRAGANLGFGKACNRGAAPGTAPFLLFLNPDARIGPGSLQAALAHLCSAAGARDGICGVQLLDEAGDVQRDCARFPSARTFLATAVGLTRIAPRFFRPIMLEEFDHRSSRHVEHVIGAFYLIRRSLFERLGGFDEQFFVYLEDLDLSRRVADAGWRTFYLAGTPSFHIGGGTSAQVKAHRLVYANSSRLLYAFKHLGRGRGWAVAIATLAIEPWIRLVQAAAKGSRSDMINTLKAYGIIWSAVPRLLNRARR